jgi:hypothetical protein
MKLLLAWYLLSTFAMPHEFCSCSITTISRPMTHQECLVALSRADREVSRPRCSSNVSIKTD